MTAPEDDQPPRSRPGDARDAADASLHRDPADASLHRDPADASLHRDPADALLHRADAPLERPDAPLRRDVYPPADASAAGGTRDPYAIAGDVPLDDDTPTHRDNPTAAGNLKSDGDPDGDPTGEPYVMGMSSSPTSFGDQPMDAASAAAFAGARATGPGAGSGGGAGPSNAGSVGLAGPAPLGKQSRRLRRGPVAGVAHFVTSHLLLHLVLLSGLALFCFPFVWMVSMSLKTDDEAAGTDFFPGVPTFRAVSPYVRPADDPPAPDEVDDARWAALLPQLTDHAGRFLSAASLGDARQSLGVPTPAVEAQPAPGAVPLKPTLPPALPGASSGDAGTDARQSPAPDPRPPGVTPPGATPPDARPPGATPPDALPSGTAPVDPTQSPPVAHTPDPSPRVGPLSSLPTTRPDAASGPGEGAGAVNAPDRDGDANGAAATTHASASPAVQSPDDAARGTQTRRAQAPDAPTPGTGADPARVTGVDPAALRAAAARRLVTRVAQKIAPATFAGDGAVAAFDAAVTAIDLSAARDASLGRLELNGLQIRTLDAHVYNVLGYPAPGGNSAWTVLSGSASVESTPTGDVLHYDFTKDAAPVRLRCTFTLPYDDPRQLHKLMLPFRADDSWHCVDVVFRAGPGHAWKSDLTYYLAQHRAGSLTWQPPTFDDETFQAKTWQPLVAAPDLVDAAAGPRQASVELTLTPSGTFQAIYGKVQRNYARAFRAVPFWTYVRNSVILVVLELGGVLFSSLFVAYAFARLNWPGRGVAMAMLLSTMMLPSQVTMIPGFLIWQKLGWYNTLNPLWIASWFGNAFFIFLMVQHMKTLPKELEEAARIDGLNSVQTWWYILVPQCAPTLAAIAIMSFMATWNNFMGPLILLRDQAKFPLSLGLYGMNIEQGTDWPALMAGNLLMTLPVIVIFLLFQRYFIEGVTVSGMKG